MIGARKPSYSSSYRQRRSFQKYYVGLFFLCAFLLWQSRGLSATDFSAQNIVDEALSSRIVSHQVSKTGSQSDIEDSFPHYGDEYPAVAGVDPEPTASVPEDDSKKDSRAQRKHPADTRRSSPQDVSEEHDTETIDKIKDSTGDTVDHETKLLHPDDDDAALSDTEAHDFTSDGMDKVGGSADQKPLQADLSNLSNPAKEPKEPSIHDDPDEEHEGPIAGIPKVPHRIEVLSEMTPWSERYSFPPWEECEDLKAKADALPDMIHVPFEEAVKDMTLAGWEDDWIAYARYTGPKLSEPKIDFVYNWVNGSQLEFKESMRPYELNSTLAEDPNWLESHSTNRYREWNELRYSMRSVEKYAGNFLNRIQILVNAFQNSREEKTQPITYGKQRPHWLRDDVKEVQVLSQEEFFGPDEKKCLPTFDSLTIENQLYNTKSETDRLVALSDDMLLGKPHSASDFYSPLFGPTMGFKDNAYNTLKPPTEEDALRFGEKPFLIYTSWLLNRRFGARKRKGQVHFSHSLGREVYKEAITSFPRPAMRSAMQRFRGETGFQLYSWFVAFHYTMERHREALLWSYLIFRADANSDGYLDWAERSRILRDIGEGLTNETPDLFRERQFYRVAEHLQEAGLEAPQVNTDILWTSMDGPAMIKDLDCDAFDTEDCLAPGFSMPSSDSVARSPVFSSAAILDRVSRQSPRCGDCLLKLLLNRKKAGLSPLLPSKRKKPEQRSIVVKALHRYSYTIVKPDADFHMITDAEQAEHNLLRRYTTKNKTGILVPGRRTVGQMCLNDDVLLTDETELDRLSSVISKLFEALYPEPSSYEK